MILYSKSGDFLGIGKDELSFLGYEDLDEFKSLHTDVADLFVNKPGYIFKFKNFSWIDYTLHSGAPKKSVILKLKNGNELESTIKIKEVFLLTPKDNEKLYYSVEFVGSLGKTNQLTIDPTPSISIPSQNINFEQNRKSEEDKINIFKTSFVDDYENNVEEIEENEEAVIKIAEPIEEETQYQPTLKIKIDNTILEEKTKPAIFNNPEINESEINALPLFNEDSIKSFEDEIPLKKIKIDDNFEPDIQIKEAIKIDPIYDEDYQSEELNISLKSDTNLKEEVFEEMLVPDEPEIEFDLLECVEKLGLDINLVSELLTDYIAKLDTTIPLIKIAINEDNDLALRNDIYTLKGISDSLDIQQISNNLVKILHANSKENKKSEIEKFEKIVSKFKGELI